MSFLWILLIGTAAIAATLMLVQGWERRRARLLKEVGTALGFRAVEKNEPLAVPSVEIMRKRGRIIGAALEGTWKGERVLVFDLSYPAGKSISQTTVFMLRLSEPRLPEFAAIPKNIWLYTPTVDLPRVETRPGPLKSHWLLYAPEGQWNGNPAACSDSLLIGAVVIASTRPASASSMANVKYRYAAFPHAALIRSWTRVRRKPTLTRARSVSRCHSGSNYWSNVFERWLP